MTDKIKEIRARHENGKSRNSHHRLGEVIDSLNYLHGLDQLHDKDDGWETQLTNVVWWVMNALEGSPSSFPPSVSTKIWEAFIVGDFDSTLGVATDGARHHLKDAIEDRATLLAEVERLRSVISTLEIVGKAADDERAKFFAEIQRLHQAHDTACQGGELLRGEVERLQAELDAMKAGFEVAYQALGTKP